MSRNSSPACPPPSSPASISTPRTRTGSPNTPVASSSKLPSTAPSTPPPIKLDIEEEDDEDMSEEDKEKWKKLEPFLTKVSIYSKLLKDQMEKASQKQQQAADNSQPEGTAKKSTRPQSKAIPLPSIPKFDSGTRKTRAAVARKGKKRTRAIIEDDEDDEEEETVKKAKMEVDLEETKPTKPAGANEDDVIFMQPALVTGAKLKNYQLEGVAWMAGLYQNGISGILADEMGLGKTLQTIAFHAYIRERSPSPFLVVCPLSVLHNWGSEFKKFAPTIPFCLYHGTPEHRANLRKTVMVLPEIHRDKYWVAATGTSRATKGRGRPPKRRPRAVRNSTSQESEEEEGLPPHMKTTFPVVITTYDMVMKDRAHLAAYRWGFIVVDEGHRLKNMDCKLMQEIKRIQADGRMVLTGTPLHNNLAELWSLLNFVLPDIFSDLYTFQDWFNLPAMQASASNARSTRVIHSLHAILRPFLLRRLKVDVETNLPPKKEYVLYAPLSERQHELYDAIVSGGLRALLIQEGKAEPEKEEAIEVEDDDDDEGVVSRTRSKNSGKERVNYAEDSDSEYFRKLESGEYEAQEERKRLERFNPEDWHLKARRKKVNNMRLQNMVMQLRKVCSHPFLFEWPADPVSAQLGVNEDLESASGKMMVLDRLLTELFKRGHKVLLFSQFTTMLDIIEDWATEFKQWPLCRIDGSTSMEDRREAVDSFQNSGDDPSAPKLFLLSTRAGGLGLNLVAADTVIFYDQDWNPQMDLQAQDRAHRIGQTKPVLIFRLVSAHTVETRIMERATEKRKLEALVIAKGKFKAPAGAPGARPTRPETMAEMAAALLRLEGEKIQVVPNTEAGKASVISDKDLDMLLDRSPGVFAGRGKGWTSAEKAGDEKAKEKAAFAVYEAPADEGNDALADMMGEPIRG